MESLIALLHSWTIAAGFWGVFSVAFLQEVVPPLPSTAISLSLGFVLLGGEPLTTAALWRLFLYVGLPVAAGLTMGSVIIYFLVRWGGMKIIDRWGKWIGVTNADIETLQSKLKGHAVDEVLLFASRAVPFVPSVAINIVAGLVRWNLGTFIILTFVGTIIRAMWSAALGWQLGSALQSYAAVIERIQLWAAALLVLGGIGFVWYRRRHVSSNQRQSPTSNP